MSQMTHATGSSSASSLALNAPIVSTLAGMWISATGACFLLNVIRSAPATHAERVCLASSLSE